MIFWPKKPCWELEIKLFFVKCSTNESLITDSVILHKIQVKETGLYLPGLSFEPLLRMGVTFAHFHFWGTLPSLIDFVNKKHSG